LGGMEGRHLVRRIRIPHVPLLSTLCNIAMGNHLRRLGDGCICLSILSCAHGGWMVEEMVKSGSGILVSHRLLLRRHPSRHDIRRIHACGRLLRRIRMIALRQPSMLRIRAMRTQSWTRISWRRRTPVSRVSARPQSPRHGM
jgi:hypothetical protein